MSASPLERKQRRLEAEIAIALADRWPKEHIEVLAHGIAESVRGIACTQADGYAGSAIGGALTELDRIIAEDRARGTQFHPDYFVAYPNGCPIIPESND